MEPKGQVSPDGQWYWDGQKWASTLSPDGRWRWDGAQWAASGAPAVHPSSVGGLRRIPGLRTGATWKLPLVGLLGFVVLAAANTAGSQHPSTSADHQVVQTRTS